MTPDQYCQNRVLRSGSSFYYSFLFLPNEQRLAIHALYAFCREVDDVVDECSDPVIARQKLQWWRSEIANMLEGNPQHPVAKALLPAMAAFKLPSAHLIEIIDGMQMDLDYNRYPDFATLEIYCYRVAGVVGLLAAEIFGYKDPSTREFARQLGIALQLTNIIRDVREDIGRNRVYIPLKDLEQFGVQVDDIVLYRETDAFKSLISHQITRAISHYERAASSLCAQDRRSQRASLIMGNIYRTLLDEIRQGGCKVLSERTALPPLRKFWIAWKTWITST
ncbi:MAG: squalene synthase HpnD [Betaproteobacteria bacterium]|nr:squalene synthase HpnD [Betaproteobacteria bacterium]